MKKFFAFAMTLVMMASVSVTAFAADTSPKTGMTSGDEANIEVKGTYIAGGTSGEKVSVEVSWDEMSFNYTGASDGVWDPTIHNYKAGTDGAWSTDTKTITVKNHSNVAITATLSFKQNTALEGKTITGTFTEESGDKNDNVLELESADEYAYQTTVDGVYPAPTATAEFGIIGDAISENTTLGTITVAISNAGGER